VDEVALIHTIFLEKKKKRLRGVVFWNLIFFPYDGEGKNRQREGENVGRRGGTF
jgi:hypothetical protein